MKSFETYKDNLRHEDDLLSLQALANGSSTLDLIYDWQFVQNEVCRGDPYHVKLSHTPIGPGTMTGTVYQDDHAIQTFVFKSDGGIVLQRLDVPKHVHPGRVVDGRLNLQTGEIKFSWYGKPQRAYFVISYEYNIECQYSLYNPPPQK
jgi:hypothetical protein